MTATEAHRRAQLAIGADTEAMLVALWRRLNPTTSTEYTRWLVIATGIIAAQRDRSADLAATYYDEIRTAHVGATSYTPLVVAGDINPQIITSLTVTGPVAVRKALARGVNERQAIETAQAGTARAGLRHALNAGRATLLANVAYDRRARGWRRVVSSGACHYCSQRAGQLVVSSSADFHAHDGCGCSAQPIFT